MVATPASLRRMNQRTLVLLLGRLGRASRAELAKAAGMSQPTAGKIVDELLDDGVLEEVPVEAGERNGQAAQAKLGRPGRLLRLDGARPRFVAIQLGVMHTRLAMLPVAVDGEDQWTVTFRTPRTPGQWVQALDKARQQLPELTPWGILLSVPGVVDESSGKVLLGPNLHWMESANLQDLVRQAWTAPVALVQEIRALALGHLTAEPATRDFLLVDFGQGVGGAAVVGGKLLASPLPLSGELGHTPVLGNRRPCGCGGIGCVETLVSRKGLLQSFAEHGSSHHWTHLLRHVQRHGVTSWLAHSLDAAAVTIAGALNVLGLRQVIVTGSLTELPPAVIDHLAAAVQRGAMWGRFGQVTCHSAPRRWMAGLVAAGIDRLLVPIDR